jgi:hypothetical protein
MAFLRKYIDRNTYLLIVGVANAVTVAVSAELGAQPIAMGLAITVLNLVVAWLGVETQTAPTAAAP